MCMLNFHLQHKPAATSVTRDCCFSGLDVIGRKILNNILKTANFQISSGRNVPGFIVVCSVQNHDKSVHINVSDSYSCSVRF